MNTQQFETLQTSTFQATNLLIELLDKNATFNRITLKESTLITERDNQDILKLKEGIEIAITKGLLSDKNLNPSIKNIGVGTRTPKQIAEDILQSCPSNKQYLLALSGLSGTGKGTVVSILNSSIPNSICWSNGDLFRLLTLMTVNYVKSNKLEFDDNLLETLDFSQFIKKIKIEISENGYDLIIENDNGFTKLSNIKNRELKKVEVSTKIPSVARYTQGEVILFSTKLFTKLMDKGHTILLEGREPTLAHYYTTNRFQLVLDDKMIIGKRRASQKILAELHKLDSLNLENIESYLKKILDNYS